MKTVTLEVGGRVMIPQDLRDELGLVEGESLALEVVDGRLVLGPARAELARKGHALVIGGAPVEAGVDLAAAREARDQAVLTTVATRAVPVAPVLDAVLGDGWLSRALGAGRAAVEDLQAHGLDVYSHDEATRSLVVERPDGRRFLVRLVGGAAEVGPEVGLAHAGR